MQNKKSQDNWTKAFCAVFAALEEHRLISKKNDFSSSVGLKAPSILNHILSGERNFPIKDRVQALEFLKRVYEVNPEFFDNNREPMSKVDWSKAKFKAIVDSEEQQKGKTGALNYSQLLDYHNLKKEVERLRKEIADKDKIIRTQEKLIEALEKR